MIWIPFIGQVGIGQAITALAIVLTLVLGFYPHRATPQRRDDESKP